MTDATRAPASSMLRLSRYHCFFGELLASEDAVQRITSRQIADELGVSDETVRRDLSYLEMEGRPGAGYDPAETYEALETFLGLSRSFPFAAIGTQGMLEALRVVFPSEQFGLDPAAYFSAEVAGAGGRIGNVAVFPVADIPVVLPDLGVSVALVACEQHDVPETLRLLDEAGVRSVLMLTPMLRPQHPEGMNVTYFRIPCALKALAASAPQKKPCCETASCCHGSTPAES